jgi:hypothetical protein
VPLGSAAAIPAESAIADTIVISFFMFLPPNVAERLLLARFKKMFLPAVTNRQTQIGLLIDMKNLIHHRFEGLHPAI